MRIAIDARNINSSTGRYAERLIHYLEELDTVNDYTIIVLEKDVSFYKPTNPKFSIIGVPYPWFSLSEQIGMARFLYKLSPDVVHFTMPHHPIFYFRPYVTTFHDLILLHTYNSDKNYFVFKTKQFVGRFVYKAMARWSTHLITPTNYVKNELCAFGGVSQDKITVTNEGCALDDISAQEYTLLKNKRYIMYVGQQSDYKNIRRLMQAHQRLRQTHGDLLLVLVGRLTGKNGKPLQTNKTWAEQQGFKGILFTDFLPDNQLRWMMQHCQAYVFPSLMEGFGLPGLEAMATGAPVVSSNATCLPEVYGDAAHYFDPIDVTDMTRAITDVLTNEKLRRTLIQKGERQSQKYSWQRMAEQTLHIYNNLLSTGARSKK